MTGSVVDVHDNVGKRFSVDPVLSMFIKESPKKEERFNRGSMYKRDKENYQSAKPKEEGFFIKSQHEENIEDTIPSMRVLEVHKQEAVCFQLNERSSCGSNSRYISNLKSSFSPKKVPLTNHHRVKSMSTYCCNQENESLDL